MLTLPVPDGVRVVRVRALAVRRGAAPEARALYEDIAEAASAHGGGPACMGDESSAYGPT
ncbi:MAG: hypothetical protein WDN49_22225 [Acetobacteraceae bacterium]